MGEAFLRIGIEEDGVWSDLIAPRCVMVAFGYANLQEMLATPLSNLLLIVVPHLPLAQVNLLPEKPKSTALNSNKSSFK